MADPLGGGVVLTEIIRRVPILRSPDVADDAVGGLIGNAKEKAKELIGISSNNTGSFPADDPKCKTQGVTNAGIIKSARWQAILNGAILAINTYNSLRMGKLQRDIGQRYQALAEEQRKYYNDRYKPLERDLTREALNLPKYKRDKEQFIAGQMLIDVRGATAGAITNAITCTGRYCTGQRATIMNDMLLQQASTESMVAGMAHRYVDKDEMVHNNLRWDKREQVLRVGRDIPTQAVSYASLASGIFGSIAKQAGDGAEGAIMFLDYNRGQTNYPDPRLPTTIGAYYFEPTKIEHIKIERSKVYEPPKEPETTIKLSG